jgi:hypothetical protein
LTNAGFTEEFLGDDSPPATRDTELPVVDDGSIADHRTHHAVAACLKRREEAGEVGGLEDEAP